MLVLPQTVMLQWAGSAKKIYTEKGYKYTGRFKYFEVDVLDLAEGSHASVLVICDYCGAEHSKMYKSYIANKKKDIIKKDCCKECQNDKYKESVLFTYGIENTFQLADIKNKIKKTNFKNLGFNYPSQSPLVQEKIRKKLFNNGTAPCSKQQAYLHSVLGGELNFPFGSISLDIAFPDEKLYIEYDGGGHLLSVMHGIETMEQFNRRNINRWYLLKRKGWKAITIISKKDFLPSKEKILEIIEFAKEYLNKDHSWIEFDIDNKNIYCTSNDLYLDFGKVYKIINK